MERLNAFSISERATLFITMLAAFCVLLYRDAGGDDLVVGIPVANRRRADVVHLIGFFANTLALRTNLSGQPTFRQSFNGSAKPS